MSQCLYCDHTSKLELCGTLDQEDIHLPQFASTAYGQGVGGRDLPALIRSPSKLYYHLRSS